jgi:AcrR family transcriptional regulator
MPKIVDHDSRRQAYVDAMWRVVSREGAGGISVRSVAAEAGVSPSNIVHYFPTRSEMLGEAVRRLVDNALVQSAAINHSNLDLERATEMVMVAIPHTPARRRQSEVWLLLVAEQGTSSAAWHILHELQTDVLTSLRRGLDLFADAGLVSDARNLDLEAVRLHTLVDGLSLQSLISPSAMPPQMIRQVVHRHLADLAAAPVGVGPSRN